MAYSCGYSRPTTRRTRSRTRSAPSSTWSAASSASSRGMTLPRRRLRLGLAVAARRRALRRAGHRRDDRGRAEGVHRRRGSPSAGWRTGSRSGCRTTATCPSAATVRRRRLDRDGRARRRAELPDVRRGAAPLGAGPAAGCWSSRCRAPAAQVARRRPVHRVVHRARHAHAPGRRDRRPPRARRPRGARRARAARALRAAPSPAGWSSFEAQPSTGSSSWSARRSSASGGSTSSAARWPSATAGWASTRS